jgi:hypothetical protein
VITGALAAGVVAVAEAVPCRVLLTLVMTGASTLKAVRRLRTDWICVSVRAAFAGGATRITAHKESRLIWRKKRALFKNCITL